MTSPTMIAWIAAAGALACWIVGAIHYGRTLAALSGEPGRRWRAIVAWPFAVRQLQGAAARHVSVVQRSLAGFLFCILIGLAAAALALQRSS